MHFGFGSSPKKIHIDRLWVVAYEYCKAWLGENTNNHIFLILDNWVIGWTDFQRGIYGVKEWLVDDL